MTTEKMLVLRTCRSDMTSSNGFVWPREGCVVAPDWDPTPRCGGGLHGLLWGEGDGNLLDWSEGAVWLVVEIDRADLVDLGGKVKFPRGNVVFAGTREEAVGRIVAHPEAQSCAIVGATVIAGDDGIATVGMRGTATAGDEGTATAGSYGTATAGIGGTATVGMRGTATAGSYGTATAGMRGTATAGSYGTATAGIGGTATVGMRGTATVGMRGTATAGMRGTATAGSYGTAMAGDFGVVIVGCGGVATSGDRGVISIRFEDTDGMLAMRTAVVGDDQISPNVPYQLDGDGRFLEAK